MPKSRTRSSSTKDIAASSSSNLPSSLVLSKQPSHLDTNNGSESSNKQSLLLLAQTQSQIPSKPIDLSNLSSIVTDLITGKRDETAYEDFLSIFEHYSVRSLRDDHLEETFYHLIQAAVTLIRANQQRFDATKLDECYRHRQNLRTNSIQ